ncbi:MAG: 16S rRNA (cytidine(1402)-2'-O)-methyltransferase [Candidatus Solincola sediminis]|nr:MAG: 16S rRNA (cytidine(1402)-2'-O)-methyltransferase [Candidatus Solincola sediminis]
MSEGKLFLVGTPIGNLEDITMRALRILREVDLIAAEDTRHTRKLLSHYDIHTPLVSYRAHNEKEKAEEITANVESGKRVALVSDAGMPGVSDPGFRVVAECAGRGLPVEVVPGPSSVSAALALAGLPLSRFRYEGFLPEKQAQRRSRLLHLLRENEAFLLFEAPHRILATLEDLADMGSERQVVIAREMTKVHEEVLRGTARDLLQAFKDRKPRGEFVIIVAPGGEREAEPLEDLADQVGSLIEEGMPAREAVKAVAQKARVSQRDVYTAWLDKKKN